MSDCKSKSSAPYSEVEARDLVRRRIAPAEPGEAGGEGCAEDGLGACQHRSVCMSNPQRRSTRSVSSAHPRRRTSVSSTNEGVRKTRAMGSARPLGILASDGSGIAKSSERCGRADRSREGRLARYGQSPPGSGRVRQALGRSARVGSSAMARERLDRASERVGKRRRRQRRFHRRRELSGGVAQRGR